MSQRRGLTCPVCLLPLPTLRGDLDCGLPDPLRTLGAITQGRGYAINSVAVLRRILGRVDPSGLRHHVRHLRCEPHVVGAGVEVLPDPLGDGVLITPDHDVVYEAVAATTGRSRRSPPPAGEPGPALLGH
jgi:hypothetical protein